MPSNTRRSPRVVSMRTHDGVPSPQGGGGQDPEARRRVGIALGIGLVASLLCVVLMCGMAFATGGLALITLRRAVTSQEATTSGGAERVAPGQEGDVAGVAVATPTLILSPTAVEPLPVLDVTPVVTAVASPTPDASPTPVISPTTVASPTVTPEETQRQVQIFRRLWDAVNENYIYRDFNGVDWKAAGERTERVIRAGVSQEQFYELMRDLVASLNDDHSSFLSPEEAQQEEADYHGTGEYIGIGVVSDVNIEKKYIFILQVLPDSPAEKAGLLPHDHILSIDGEPAVTGGGDVNTHLLRGTEGTAVTVTVRTPGSQPRDVAITRASLSTVEPVEQRLLPGKKRIGYILIPTFFEESIEERVRVALRALMKGGRLDGLIVDLRINGGGAYPVLLANLGFYTRGTVGYLVDRKGVREPLTVRAERIGNSQSVPMVVLIGPSTQSYAEVFAGTLRVRKRATLLGQKSGGNIETLHAHRFEDGSVAWIAEETFRLPNGTHWEGQGLSPDTLVDQGWDEFTGENDPVIAAAVKVLSK